jgi:hypothetical protein
LTILFLFFSFFARPNPTKGGGGGSRANRFALMPVWCHPYELSNLLEAKNFTSSQNFSGYRQKYEIDCPGFVAGVANPTVIHWKSR